MSSEISSDQRLLLWHLALLGGEAQQKQVEYKQIAKDRKELRRRAALYRAQAKKASPKRARSLLETAEILDERAKILEQDADSTRLRSQRSNPDSE